MRVGAENKGSFARMMVIEDSRAGKRGHFARIVGRLMDAGLDFAER